ncbi:MAG: alpha-L-fucosidase, partial [Clostridia bacterium]|nr:alpha-L-fucosidase [Clostridia bacterium]
MTKEEYRKTIDDVIAKGRYKADWASLSGHKTPTWYYEGKFGIFIHWGVYSVPGYGNEWYPRSMYDKNSPEFEHHRRAYGDQKDFGYKDFIPLFTAERFDPDGWISLFREAGARFVMPVCEHHDGFAMYDTAFNRWNAKAMGPRRDVAAELKDACERQGLTFCAS